MQLFFKNPSLSPLSPTTTKVFSFFLYKYLRTLTPRIHSFYEKISKKFHFSTKEEVFRVPIPHPKKKIIGEKGECDGPRVMDVGVEG